MYLHWIILPVFLLFSCAPNPETDQTETEVQSEYPAEVATDTTNRFDLTYLMGKFDPLQHPDFVQVDPQYADNDQRYLHKDTYAAFLKMREAAEAEGVQLRIISATRPFDHQKRIWEAKWNGSRLVDGKDLSKAIPDPAVRALKILEYSSMPGTSRHHWGTDVDFNDLENSYFEKGKGLKEYEWLSANAPTFGFCQVYTEKDALRPNGYNLEKWHWSYLPLAKELTQLAKTQLKDEMISGFDGAEAAVQIGVVEKYVLGINPECL